MPCSKQETKKCIVTGSVPLEIAWSSKKGPFRFKADVIVLQFTGLFGEVVFFAYLGCLNESLWLLYIVFDCARSSRMIHNKLDALASQELSFLLGPEDEVSAPFLFFPSCHT